MGKQILTLGALATLGFAVTLAVPWILRAPSAPAALPGRAALSRFWSSVVPHVSPAAVSAATPGAAPPRAPYAPYSSPEVPPYDVSGPPLPVMLATSSHAGRAEDDADGDTVDSNRVVLVRQVDLVNESDEPLEITVLATDVPTQETTQAQLFVPPHAQAHVDSESGLKLEPGYQVALRSRGFQELTQTVR